MNELKALICKDEFEPEGKHKSEIMKALVHGADIGNPTRSFPISKQWALKILTEFFA